MKLNYNKKELHQLFKDFYDLTQMTMTLYDPEGEWIFSYPSPERFFCECIKSSPEGCALCEASDRASFDASRMSGECVIYKCHAGLVEATAPIISDGFTIGYIMLGQVSNVSTPEQLQTLIQQAFSRYHLEDIEDSRKTYAAEIPCISNAQIRASARIMEACISSILYKKLISVEKQQFEQKINAYIMAHLTENLTVEQFCRQLNLSRRKLYEYSRQFLHCSIARYTRELRIQHAEELLVKTDLSVSEISEQCGFTDYNYFCRIFKQKNGMPARAFRAAHRV